MSKHFTFKPWRMIGKALTSGVFGGGVAVAVSKFNEYLLSGAVQLDVHQLDAIRAAIDAPNLSTEIIAGAVGGAFFVLKALKNYSKNNANAPKILKVLFGDNNGVLETDEKAHYPSKTGRGGYVGVHFLCAAMAIGSVMGCITEVRPDGTKVTSIDQATLGLALTLAEGAFERWQEREQREDLLDAEREKQEFERRKESIQALRELILAAQKNGGRVEVPSGKLDKIFADTGVTIVYEGPGPGTIPAPE